VVLPTGPGEARRLPAGGLNLFQSVWLPDSRRVVSSGSAPGSRPRCFTRSIDGGDPQPLTPEGVTRCRLPSPDGRFLFVNRNQLFDIQRGTLSSVPGLTETDEPIRWSGDGRSLFVIVKTTDSAWSIQRVDVGTGRREPVRDLHTAGPVGAGGLVNAHISADGRSVVYTSSRYFSDLFLIEGLR
jgi:hypothetical protein